MTTPVLTTDEVEALVKDAPLEEQIAARVVHRHQNVMAAITDKERQWAATIGKISLEQILGESIELT